MSRPDRIYFIESPRGPHGGPHFDLDEALADALAKASVAGREARVVGVPVDYCETIEPPQRPAAAKDSMREAREAAERAWLRPCGDVNHGRVCGLDRGHEGEHISGDNRAHRWPR